MPHESTRATPDLWRRHILQYIANHPDRPLKPKPLARELRIPHEAYREFRDLVRQMLEEGAVTLGRGRALKVPDPAGPIVGVFRAHPKGFGFVESTGRPDIYIARNQTGDALEGDTVAVRLHKPAQRTKELYGEVIRVVTRAPTRWVGILERLGQRWVVRPQGKAGAPLVRIDDPTAKAAKPGDLVVVEPLEEDLSTRFARGVIVEKLGPQSDAQTRIRAVIRRLGIPDSFSAEVRRQARETAFRFGPAAWEDREDLRELLTITIDPLDARDFDDAISLQNLPNGHIELGVHIADVANFVPADSPLDQEARLRGNSVYFPGYVVPMLPETLSNGVCSLQPGEPRLVKSVFITYDDKAKVVATRFTNSVIRSRARLTYEEATSILDGKSGDIEPQIFSLLKQAETLAKRIRQRRLANGMIVLTLPETEIKLDDAGRVIDAGPADTSFSHTIIEMFMVEANEAVCRALARAGIPHLRRIHPEPDPEATRHFAQLVAVQGRHLPRALDQRGIQDLLESVRGKTEERAVNYLLLRSLAQAAYSPAPLGHFALASEDYCHFTSPIRRYPDLINHRLLDLYIRGDLARLRTEEASLTPDLDELARHTSHTERRAQQAEREARTLLLLEFMKTKIGETFEGVITGIVSAGAFVQVLPYMAEGLIRVADFGSEIWEYDSRKALFTGKQTKRMVTLGQTLRVVVVAVDEFRQQMNLAPADGGPIGMIRNTAGKSGKTPSRLNRILRPPFRLDR